MPFSPNSHSVISIGGPAFQPPAFEHYTTVSSPYSETTSSRFSMSSLGSAEELDLATAHMAYARQMVSHTALMWQKERLAIEKAKLDGTWTGSETSRTNGSAKPVDTTPPKKDKKSRDSTSSSESEGSRTIFGFELRGRSRKRRD